MTESLEKIEEQEPQNLQPQVKPEISERQLPIGIGGTKLKEGTETLPAVEVGNEVSWVNNKMNLPFDLKVGESSRLGMFLTPNPQTGENTYNLEVSYFHTRSGILGRVIFSDKEGHLYRDIDLKGVGFSKGHKVESVTKDNVYISPRWSFSFGGTAGIANQELIKRDIDFSEKFLKAGIRTHRVVALFDLKEIVGVDGKRISIAEAKKRGILSQDDEPVIEMRAYGTKSRLADIYGILNSYKVGEIVSAQAQKLILDAKNIVAQEMNVSPESFSLDSYLFWLVETTAVNIARMHYNKWVSGYLTVHNLTLDGRIVDLDSVETITEAKRGTEYPLKSSGDDLSLVTDSLGLFLNSLRCNLGIEINAIKTEKNVEYMTNSYFLQIYDEEIKRLKSEKKIRKLKK